MKTIRTPSIVLVALALAGMSAGAYAAVPAEDVKKIQAAAPAKARVKPVRQRRILVFNLTRGFVHKSIPHGALALEVMGEKTGAYTVVASSDIAMFEPRKLKRFDAVVFNNTTGELFLPPGFAKLSKKKQAAALKREAKLKESLLAFIRGGKGVVGIHAATDCFYEWPEFGRLMGGYFNGHPWHELVSVAVDDPGHPLTAIFKGKGFDITDEIYQFKAPYSRENLKILLKLDRAKTSGKGARADNDYAISWIRTFGKGRVFYCSLGHRNEIFWNPLVLQFYLDGIQYALGDLKADAAPSGMTGPIDIWMGEYAGSSLSGGRKVKATGTVIPTGDGRYAATLQAGEETIVLEGRMNGQALSLSRQTFDGYVTDWEVAGPYSKKGKDGKALFDVAFAPEKDFDSDKVDWRDVELKDRANPWLVDLDKVIGGNDVVAYLRAKVRSLKAQKARLSLGSDDGLKVWVNGVLFHANDVMRGVTPGEDEVIVKFKKGWNDIVLKINQGTGGWGACARVEPLGGGRLKGLTSSGEKKWTGKVVAGALEASAEGGRGQVLNLERVVRKSPTLGLKPPPGAVVLLAKTDGVPSTAEWMNPRWSALAGGVMQCGKGDNRTRRKFGDMRLHIEFMVPYEPAGRGQGRGNSGVYFQDRYEVQILDSFGLPPMDNGCGGIYKVSVPRVNASLPPLEWQAYDVEFFAPRLDGSGKVKKNVRITVRHNGLLIHDDVEVPAPTGGAASMEPVAKAPLRLQDHGHRVQFRNIWVAEQ